MIGGRKKKKTTKKEREEGEKKELICILDSQYAQDGKTGHASRKQRDGEMMQRLAETLQATSVCAERASGGDT